MGHSNFRVSVRLEQFSFFSGNEFQIFLIFRQDFNKEDEKALPKKGVEKGKPTAPNKTETAADQEETPSNQNQPRFIKSNLQPSAIEFNPHLSS